MTRIVLVRHGETVWHSENRYAGSTDVSLTPKGMRQAEELAIWARHAGISAVWSSTLSRARITAQPAADALNLPLQVDKRLVELDFGRGEGLTDAEMEAQFPAERAAFKHDPVIHHLPGGEDPVQAAQRATTALVDIAAASPEGRILVVAHNTLIRLVLCKMLEIPLSRYRTVFPQLMNGTLTELSLSAPPLVNAALLSFNAPLSATE
ncbi:MAG TPA: histidine phosphatase family protein [Edaphobacter sp.]|nr:histidine phosphatase family protein [Edaphobacter sp.]